MTTTEIVLTCIFGSLGYLLIGWLTFVVLAARFPMDDEIQSFYLTTVPFWPLCWAFGVLAAAILCAKPLTEKAILRLNPSMKRKWF